MSWQSELDALVEETLAFAEANKGKTLKPVVPIKLIEQALPKSPRATRLEPLIWPAFSEREEIKQRVADFKAIQERMRRERDDYFVNTLEKARRAP
jgi:hypothetical protein